jgi:hypothetical protein
MKKARQSKGNTLPNKNFRGTYSAQDFEQGRGGIQSGHKANSATNIFSQFSNKGNGGYAAEQGAHAAGNEVVVKRR